MQPRSADMQQTANYYFIQTYTGSQYMKSAGEVIGSILSKTSIGSSQVDIAFTGDSTKTKTIDATSTRINLSLSGVQQQRNI